MTRRPSTALRMSEAQLQTAVIELAHRLGYLAAHFRAAQTRDGRWQTPVQADAAGWPDLILAHPDGRLHAVELKANGNKPSPAQIRWLELLAGCGVKADVWDDNDWRSGHIEVELRGADPSTYIIDPEPEFLGGLRAFEPTVCWRLLEGDKRCCILPRGHDDGIHELADLPEQAA